MQTSHRFQHIILTRFNLATPGRESELRNRPGWLARRFDLFETYCIPSVAMQSCKEFTWIIYFDNETPDEFRDRVDALRKLAPFTPYYTDLFDSGGWARSVRETLTSMPPWLLTTRLDNDDALAFDYVERVQTAAAEHSTKSAEERVAFVITNGFIRNDGLLFAISHPSNAFASLLESTRPEAKAEFLTAAGIKHMELEKSGKVVQISGPGGWLQVVHGENVSNKIRGKLITRSKAAGRFHDEALIGIVDDFNIADRLKQISIAPIRMVRDRLLHLLRIFR